MESSRQPVFPSGPERQTMFRPLPSVSMPYTGTSTVPSSSIVPRENAITCRKPGTGHSLRAHVCPSSSEY